MVEGKIQSKNRRFIPLRYRFILMTTTMLVVLLGVLIALISIQQRRTIRDQLEKRGVSIAQSLAAASIADLLTYNYVALERSANQAAAGPEIVAVIFHDKEGRVAGYSGRPDLQNTILADSMSERAIQSTSVFIHEMVDNDTGNRAIDIALPIYPPDVNIRWGTVRIQLSLETMYLQIRQVQLAIITTGALFLIAGIVVSILLARRITMPLNSLVRGTQAVARGDFDQNIRVNTGDEVEILADNFTTMINEVIAQRSKLELQLDEIKELQRYTGALLTTMSDGLVSITLEGEVSTINPAARTLLDVENDLAEKRMASEIFSHLPAFSSYVQKALDTSSDCRPSEVVLEKEGKEHTLVVSGRVLYDNDEAPIEMIFNLHDITELKELEASVRQNERLAALGTLAAGMAHEIRNPLSSIKTFVQLLPRKHENEGFLEKFNRTVPRELDRINHLVEDLLDLSRVPKYTFAPVRIKALVQQIADSVHGDLQEGGINLHFDCPDDLPPVRADTHQLTKALQNIIRNGIQAMAGGGVLTITASYHENTEQQTELDEVPAYVELQFKDSGEGIAPADLETIFNPFFTTKVTGTGLGLSITHKVIMEHGGTISVSSEKGAYTLFTIRLPVMQK